MRHSTTNNFPASYRYIWNKEHSKSAIVKIKALLKDYTKEESLISPFFGRLFFLHWNRHHVPAVQKIIYKSDYERAEDILFDLRQIKPKKDGSLDRRIQFIEQQLDVKSHDFVLFDANKHK